MLLVGWARRAAEAEAVGAAAAGGMKPAPGRRRRRLPGLPVLLLLLFLLFLLLEAAGARGSGVHGGRGESWWGAGR